MDLINENLLQPSWGKFIFGFVIAIMIIGYYTGFSIK